MKTNTSFAHIHPSSKQQILQSAHQEMQRYATEQNSPSNQKQSDFDPSTVLLTLLFFVGVFIIIVALAKTNPVPAQPGTAATTHRSAN